MGQPSKRIERRDKAEQMRLQDTEIRITLKRVKNKILVMSGKGGVGKSSIAAYIATAMAGRGYRTGLMDVDLHGPSIPRLLGLSGQLAAFEGGHIMPIQYSAFLKVVSMETLIPDKDKAVIWRGPLKISAIRQFLSDVIWGERDYLIIDSPPGTGDEPLTVAQTIPEARAVIVTTPQEISLADVRKSIDFCMQVNLPVLGLIENMSGLDCPHCGGHIDLFRSGGGERTARQTGVPFLGKIPIDPQIVISGDEGRPFVALAGQSSAGKMIDEIADRIIKSSGSGEDEAAEPPAVSEDENPIEEKGGNGAMKIAIPTADGLLCAHFGHCEQFALVDVEDGKIAKTTMVTPPPHEPGLLPRWLNEQGASMIIAGGMGMRAQDFFTQYGIEVIIGAATLPPEEIVTAYLSGSLETGANLCDH